MYDKSLVLVACKFQIKKCRIQHYHLFNIKIELCFEFSLDLVHIVTKLLNIVLPSKKAVIN